MSSQTLSSLESALRPRYSLERELGRGGMATVYLAEDRKHRRRVAVKVFHPDLAAELGAERFLREIEIAARLNHPHILPLFDSGEAGQHLYFVMPYVEENSLRERIRREKQLSVDEAVRIAREVAGALDYAHGEGIVHRDIKPENILLSRGHALVSDFGIARAVSMAGGVALTHVGLALGTPAYMSPEQASADGDVGPQSDIFALGCVLYEMLAGEPPYTGPTAQIIIAKRFVDPVPSPRRVRESVPEHVDAAVRRSLATVPSDRFNSAAEFATALSAPAQAAVREAEKKSVVVLPFENLSPESENAYFSDGLTEELIADLSKVRSLRVISRTSSMTLKGVKKNVRDISRDVNARYVLEGSVRRSGSSLRITAQLIDAATDTHLWADKYAGTVEDVFDLQEKLSRTIVDALRVTLTADEDRRLRSRPIRNLQAYDCYLRARQEILLFTEQALERALRLVENALRLVGDSELLHATLGYIHWNYFNIGVRANAQTLQQADDCAIKSLALEPDSSQGLLLKGLVQYKRCDMQDAVRYLKRSVAIEPTGDALMWLAVFLAEAGRESEARLIAAQAVDIDPLTPIVFAGRGLVDLLEGKFESAAEWGRTGHELNPTDFVTAFFYALYMAYAGRTGAACALFERVGSAPETGVFGRVSQLFCHALKGSREQTLLAASAVQPAAFVDEQYSWWIACCLALVGEKDQALKWLELSIQRGFINYRFFLEIDPFLEPLRGDPRFTVLMEQVKGKWEAFEA